MFIFYHKNFFNKIFKNFYINKLLTRKLKYRNVMTLFVLLFVN